MRAYQYDSPAAGLVSVDIAEPTPGPGHVVIDVKAAGLCHSDVHILNGAGDAWLGKRPIVLGHEVAGTVVALGPDIETLAIGDRVAVALIAHPIAEMDPSGGIGLGYDGGYAEKAVVPVASLVRIPDQVSFAEAAVATDSVATAYHAVSTEAGVTPGSTVAIIGLGGLGLNAVKFAVLRGATVFGVDVNPNVFDSAVANGASQCFSSVADLPTRVDAVIDFVGAGTTTAEAITAVKAGGRVALVGLGASEVVIPTHLLVTRAVQLRGSLGASLEDLQAVLGLIADGSIKPLIEQIPFDDVALALRRLAEGKLVGRLVTCPSE